jgi:tetratricopeptide (TPR) repeat protein
MIVSTCSRTALAWYLCLDKLLISGNRFSLFLPVAVIPLSTNFYSEDRHRKKLFQQAEEGKQMDARGKCWCFCFLLLCLTLQQVGCVVQNRVSSTDTNQEINRLFAVAQKVHTRVGVYLNEDLRNYVYRQEKPGAAFQMEVGRNLVPVVMTMATAMFDNAVEVESLPPYVGSYRPDIEVVIEPEILYASGNIVTTGFLSGQVVATLKLRLKAYDLSGRVIWQGEAVGENQGEQVDLVSAILIGSADKSGKAAGQAGISAAIKIIKNFNSSKPLEIYSLLELKAKAPVKGTQKSATAEQADLLSQRGMYQYDKKNFQQALYSFQQADRINPADLSTKFYLGVCQMYTGQKQRAVETLKYVLSNSRRGDSLAVNSKQWVERLNDPLKVAVVFDGSGKIIPPDLKAGFLHALTSCGMYEIVSVQDTADVQQTALNRYIDEASKKKARVVFFVRGDKSVRDVIDPTLREGDVAAEFVLNTTIKAYSTRNKKPVTEEIMLFDNAARMKKQLNAENVQTGLIKQSGKRLVLSLLGSEIF